MSFISNVSYPTNAIINGGASANNGQWRQFENQTCQQDQFDAIDNAFSRTLNTMNKPCFGEQHQQIQQQQQQQQQQLCVSYGLCPRKYRIICEEGCFMPSSVRVVINGRFVHIKGAVEKKIESPMSVLVSTKEFNKVYQLPAYVLASKYTVFFTQHGHLVVEFPIIENALTTPFNAGETYTHAESVDVTVGMVVKGSMRPVEYLPVDTCFGITKKETPRFYEQKYGGCQNNWDEQNCVPTKMGYKKFGGF